MFILNEAPVPIRDRSAATLPEGDHYRISLDAMRLLVVAASCSKSSNVMLTR
jgi:hypothetical protein